jgi:predicted nucleotidyltransferase
MTQIDAKLMDELVRRIVEVIHPEKVILFGSRARTETRPESDIDLSGHRRIHRASLPPFGAPVRGFK